MWNTVPKPLFWHVCFLLQDLCYILDSTYVITRKKNSRWILSLYQLISMEGLYSLYCYIPSSCGWEMLGSGSNWATYPEVSLTSTFLGFGELKTRKTDILNSFWLKTQFLPKNKQTEQNGSPKIWVPVSFASLNILLRSWNSRNYF